MPPLHYRNAEHRTRGAQPYRARRRTVDVTAAAPAAPAAAAAVAAAATRLVLAIASLAEDREYARADAEQYENEARRDDHVVHTIVLHAREPCDNRCEPAANRGSRACEAAAAVSER